jgi:hypothetical protein
MCRLGNGLMGTVVFAEYPRGRSVEMDVEEAEVTATGRSE